NTGATKSAITFLDGDNGILRYRGYSIEDLAAKSNFLEVAYLLHSGARGRLLCRRSAALAFPAADSRAMPRDVSHCSARERRTGNQPRVCAVPHVDRGAWPFGLRDRARHALPRPSTGRRDFCTRARVPGW